jgi:hypothetical protein
MSDQSIELGEPITGTGSGAGDTIVVTDPDGDVVGTTTVTDELAWSLVPTLGVGHWTVTATETDADGWTGTASAGVTVIPVDAPPLHVTLSQDTVRAGERLAIDATGFAPGEQVEIVLHSTPVLLARLQADGGGAIHATVTIPADTTPGPHQLVLTGALAGPISANLTVTAASDPDLASTGLESLLLMSGIAALALALGCTSLVVARRRAERRRLPQ